MSAEHKPHPEYVIPGDSIEQSPAWVHETRRCFPLLPDEEIIQAFERLTERAQHFQDRLDMEVNAEREPVAESADEWTEYHEFRRRTDPPPWGQGRDDQPEPWPDTKPLPPLPHEEC